MFKLIRWLIAIFFNAEILNSFPIENAIKLGVLNVVISIDSGCDKTYKKVKNVNAYKKVIENMKKYAEAKPDRNIVLPEINADSPKKEEKPIEEAKEYDSSFEQENYVKEVLSSANDDSDDIIDNFKADDML